MRGLAPTTASSRATWSAGSSMSVRSKPSDSSAVGQAEEHDGHVRCGRGRHGLGDEVGAGHVAPSSTKPGAKATSPAAASRIASSALSSRVGMMCELPAPWYRGVRANSPMTATLGPVASGRRAFSLRSNTIPAAAASRARRVVSIGIVGSRRDAPRWHAVDQVGQPAGRRVERRSRRACPSRTAATSCASVWPPLAGISRSSPAATPATRSFTAPQSDMTNPSKPHSSRSTVVRSQGSSRGVHAVDPVVGAHDRPRVGGPDDPLEPAQVDLPQRPLVDVGAHPQAVGLLVVRGEVLQRRADALALQAADQRRTEHAADQRVLRQVLEVAATQRRALRTTDHQPRGTAVLPWPHDHRLPLTLPRSTPPPVGCGASGVGPSAAFLGIPFAEPPVGDLRFAAPVPARAWSGVRDATEHGPTAQRTALSEITLIPEPSVPGESTLNVDVFTPSPAVGRGLPVLVWIHGGGYVAGSPASPWYDGRSFNRDGVVTVACRTGSGSTGSAGSRGRRPTGACATGCWRWSGCRTNIAAFGGDPSRVTIAGQSAGGGAVLTLLGMEAAQHLFARVYSLSGALGDVPEAKARRSGARSGRAGRRGTHARRVPVRVRGPAARAAERPVGARRAGRPAGPAGLAHGRAALRTGRSTATCSARPTLESLRLGVGADKPLVAGATEDEFPIGLGEDARHLDGLPAAARAGEDRARAKPPSARISRRTQGSSTSRVVQDLLTDRVFRSLALAAADARPDGRTWLYRFGFVSPTHAAPPSTASTCRSGSTAWTPTASRRWPARSRRRRWPTRRTAPPWPS